MLLLLLSCLLPAAAGRNCLSCWPELPALMDYDLQILWGTPGPPTDLSQSIHSLFQEKNVLLHPWYLGQDHLEEEAAKLFSHIAIAIQKLRDDKQQFMNEVRMQKRLFSDKLTERSEELKKKACNNSCDLYKMEVMDCSSCKKHVLICKDPTICAAGTERTFLWAVILSIALSLAILAVGGLYIYQYEKKRKRRAEKILEKSHSVAMQPEPRRSSSHQYTVSKQSLDRDSGNSGSRMFTPTEQRSREVSKISSLVSSDSRTTEPF